MSFIEGRIYTFKDCESIGSPIAWIGKRFKYDGEHSWLCEETFTVDDVTFAYGDRVLLATVYFDKREGYSMCSSCEKWHPNTDYLCSICRLLG